MAAGVGQSVSVLCIKLGYFSQRLEAWIHSQKQVGRVHFDVALGIATGIHAVHQIGYIHQDVKTSNILMAGQSGKCPPLTLTLIILIILALGLEPRPVAAHEEVDDEFYVEATGLSRDELLATGDYFDMDAFEEADELPVGLRTVDSYIPMAVRQREAEERDIEGIFYMTNPLNKWPKTFEDNLKALELDEHAIKMILFTLKSPPEGEILDHEELSTIRKSTFDPEANLKILIHGYNETESAYTLKDAYLEQNYTHNILVVDWSPFAQNPVYYEAAMSTYFVSDQVSHFILFLFNRHFIPSFDSVHIVGFCMGAHIAGQAGHNVRVKAPGEQKIGRITGLDPMGAGFVYARPELHLNKDNARVVDIIHTNSGVHYGDGYLGASDDTGTMDFYPNGGEHQAACDETRVVGDLISRCAHNKAVEFYVRSINEENLASCNCPTWWSYVEKECGDCDEPIYMGEHVDESQKGSFFLYVYDKSLADILGIDTEEETE